MIKKDADKIADNTVEVGFGGVAHELWTEHGLKVRYEGRLMLLAEKTNSGYLAKAGNASGCDVKADWQETEKSRELAMSINSGSAGFLTVSYFNAAAAARYIFNALQGEKAKAITLPYLIQKADDALIIPEILRILLGECSDTWENAIATISDNFVLKPQGDFAGIALGSLASLSPRAEKLIRAINEKHCQLLWDLNPGDWLRISEGSIITDNEANSLLLAASLCGKIICSEEMRAGALRCIYTLASAKFVDI